MDARLYDELLQKKSRKSGRPRIRGTPQQMLKGRRRHLMLGIYGRRDKSRVARRTSASTWPRRNWTWPATTATR